MNFKLLAILALAIAMSAQAEVVKISNSFLEVTQNKNFLTLTAKGKQVVKNIVLPNGIKNVKLTESYDPIWGKGSTLALKQNNDYQTSFTLYKGQPFVFIHTTVTNNSDTAYAANKFPVATYHLDLGVPKNKLRVIGTGHNRPFGKASGSYAYMALADPKSRHGVVMGWLTHKRGVGVFHNRNNNGDVECEAHLEFGHFLVKPKQTRQTDTFVMGYFDDARIGLEKWADAVAKQEKIKLPAKPGVYCTWYHRNITKSGASTEKAIAENADFSEKNLKPFGLGVMQIDDHWQSKVPNDSPHKDSNFKKIGPYKCFADVTKHFPGGMKKTADKISSSGMTPGIWFMPFAGNHFNPYFDDEIFAKNPDGTPYFDDRWSGSCIDSTSPKGEAFLRQRFKRVYDWGYRYFKIDGLHTGMPSKNTYVNSGYKVEPSFGSAKLYNPDMTYVECFRRGMEILHEEAPNVFLLGCTITQNMRSFGPAFGQVDAMRVGPDNDRAIRGDWNAVVDGARYCSNVYFLNARVWYNDPDPYYVRESNPLHKVRWMASWLAVSGSMNTTSNQYATLPQERLDIIKRSLPVHDLLARPVDFLDSAKPAEWLVQGEHMNIVGLFNWEEGRKKTLGSQFSRMGLDQDKSYVAFEYWSDSFLGTLTGGIKRELPKAGCEVIALREAKPYPQVLSTSRNINQGLTDLLSEKWDAKTRTLSGESLVVAGDRYELRIALDANFKIKSAVCAGKKLTNIKQEIHGARVSFVPNKTGKISWSVTFE